MIQTLLKIGLILTFLINIFFSSKAYFLAWKNDRYGLVDSKGFNTPLYGSDYELYQFVRKHVPPTAKLAYLIPDEYYQSRAMYFLYPRSVTSLYGLNGLKNTNLSVFDYLMFFSVSATNHGVIDGLNHIQSIEKWDLSKVYLSLKNQPLQNFPPTQKDFDLELMQNNGYLIYQIKTKL